MQRRQYPFLKRHALSAVPQSQPAAAITAALPATSHPSAWKALEALHAVYEVHTNHPSVRNATGQPGPWGREP